VFSSSQAGTQIYIKIEEGGNTKNIYENSMPSERT
jgi:hypothetical protein